MNSNSVKYDLRSAPRSLCMRKEYQSCNTLSIMCACLHPKTYIEGHSFINQYLYMTQPNVWVLRSTNWGSFTIKRHWFTLSLHWITR